MEKILEKLADLIILETEQLGCTYSFFADVCNISRNEIGNIVRRKRKDIKLSTILKICKHSNITFPDIFDYSDKDVFEKMIKDFCFTSGNDTYYICKK